MSQAELARLAGIHPATVSHVIRGGHCTTETLEKIAAALGVDLSELFGPPVDERTVLLKRDRVVSAVLRELCEVTLPVARERGLYLRFDGPARLEVEADRRSCDGA